MVLMALTLVASPVAAFPFTLAEEVDFEATMELNIDEPLRGSNITVTVTIIDLHGLEWNETANGTLAVLHDGNPLETRDKDDPSEANVTINRHNVTIVFNASVDEWVYRFTWIPLKEGTASLEVDLEVPGDTNTGDNEYTRSFDVGKASGVAAGETSTVATIVGVLALVLFFGVIIASVLGWIPQDRLPVQPALILATFIIMGIAFIGGTYDDNVESFGLSALASKIIIHPITALIAGFLVAGALEAAGAFEAAADGLQRMEGFRVKGGAPLFGVVGTVVLLTNLPTIIAMPCGRILAAALMPAALFFGVRVARAFQMPALVSVVIFPFIVNAAASCGPSLIGGIGTIGEGLAQLDTGSLSDAQQIGIILATGVCALVMRFVTVSVPPDLAEEEEERLEEERKQAEREKQAFKEPAGGMQP
jgi:hypothetical protein